MIERYKESDSIYDHLAVGLAYKNKYAAFRRSAIENIQYFIENANENDWKRAESVNPNFSKYFIHVYVAQLYEQENMIEKAYEYALLVPDQYELMGKILYKRDINECVEYYKNVLKDKNVNSGFKAVIKKNLDKALAKQAKGYKFHPRKKKPEVDQEMEDMIHETILPYINK